MSSTTSPNSSKGGVSKSVPQGTYSGDQMFRMFQADPKSMQSPDKTMAKLQAIFNSPDTGFAYMNPKQAEISKQD